MKKNHYTFKEPFWKRVEKAQDSSPFSIHIRNKKCLYVAYYLHNKYKYMEIMN